MRLVCLCSATCWRRCAPRFPSRRARRLTFAALFFLSAAFFARRSGAPAARGPLRHRGHRVALLIKHIHILWFFEDFCKKMLNFTTFCGIMWICFSASFFVMCATSQKSNHETAIRDLFIFNTI